MELPFIQINFHVKFFFDMSKHGEKGKVDARRSENKSELQENFNKKKPKLKPLDKNKYRIKPYGWNEEQEDE